jgi:hypothetical protein
MADLVCLNLSGKKFFVLLKNFAKLPNTRLAKMVSSDATPNLIYSLPHKNVLTRNAQSQTTKYVLVSITFLSGLSAKGLIYTEYKPLGRPYKMCYPFFHEFRVIPRILRVRRKNEECAERNFPFQQ